ncbi:hypothetical protein GEV33_003695 [Tenebrio molitor]|uniref:ISXO2-like transposase domain-containing protein n=1 Tax=Tenebrio molitor TaxID=7067 RepID=A0A8J6LNE1_TENMO|nr:hypothetical protein GEV33_003695 [Tenebrio molitor]
MVCEKTSCEKQCRVTETAHNAKLHMKPESLKMATLLWTGATSTEKSAKLTWRNILWKLEASINLDNQTLWKSTNPNFSIGSTTEVNGDRGTGFLEVWKGVPENAFWWKSSTEMQTHYLLLFNRTIIMSDGWRAYHRLDQIANGIYQPRYPHANCGKFLDEGQKKITQAIWYFSPTVSFVPARIFMEKQT